MLFVCKFDIEARFPLVCISFIKFEAKQSSYSLVWFRKTILQCFFGKTFFQQKTYIYVATKLKIKKILGLDFFETHCAVYWSYVECKTLRNFEKASCYHQKQIDSLQRHQKTVKTRFRINFWLIYINFWHFYATIVD